MNSIEDSNRLYHSSDVPRYGRWLAAVLIAAAAVRIGWGILIPVIPVSDSNAYDTFAQNIVAGHGYVWKEGIPAAVWPVGTAAVYSVIYALFGHSYAGIVVLNIVVGVLTTWLIAWLAEKWFGQSVSIAAGVLYALWPSQIQFTTVLASELLYNFLGLLCLAVWYSKTPPLWRLCACGVLFAAAAYVRTPILVVPMLLTGRDIAIARSGIVSRCVGLAVVVAIMALLVAPWSIRNTKAFGQFVLISTNPGTNLWMGNNESGSLSYMAYPQAEVQGMNEAQRDQYHKRKAMEYIRAEPLAFVWRVARRLVDLHSYETIGVAWNLPGIESTLGAAAVMPLKYLATVYWWFALALGLLGIGVLIKTDGPWLTMLHPFVLLWAYYAVVVAIVVSQDRYHFPSIPSIAVLGGLALDWIANLAKSAFARRRTALNSLASPPAL